LNQKRLIIVLPVFAERLVPRAGRWLGNEMGLVGNDGLVGIALVMGGDTMTNLSVAQLGGRLALRMKAKT
jgi:hypothetical protein